MHRYLIFAIGIVALVVLAAPWLDTLVAGDAAASDNAADVGAPVIAGPGQPIGPGAAAHGDTVSIVRDPAGQFHIDGSVNGHSVRFLVDTGADRVALSEADASAAGISIDPGAFTTSVTTASGKAMAAPLSIDQLNIAGHDLDNVDAMVVQGLNVSLLGQSALRRLGPVNMAGDTMTIGGAGGG